MRWAIPLAVTVLAIVAFSGCGGGDDDPAEPVPTARRSRPTPPPPPPSRAKAPSADADADESEDAKETPGDADASDADATDAEPDSPADDAEGDTADEPDPTPSAQLDLTNPLDKSADNLRQISAALMKYHQDKKEFPAPANYDKARKPLLSWRVHLLPYLPEGQLLYQQFHLDEAWDSEHNKQLAAEIPDVFKLPGRDDETTNYHVPVGPNAAFRSRANYDVGDVSDGLEMTIMVVETSDDHAVPWTKPGDFANSSAVPTRGLKGPREGGFLAAFGDGKIRLLSPKLGTRVLRGLFTKSSREGIDLAGIRVITSVDPQLLVALGESAQPDGADSEETGNNRPTAGTGDSPDEPKAEDLVEAAHRLLAAGEEERAFDHLYASALTADLQEMTQKLMWVKGVSRPTLALRWGIGVQLNAPRNFASSPHLPSRTPKKTRTGPSAVHDRFPGRGPGDPGYGGGGPRSKPITSLPVTPDADPDEPIGPSLHQPSPFIRYFLGKPGDRLIEALEERIEDGSFGTSYVLANEGGRSRSGPRISREPPKPGDPPPENVGIRPGITLLGLGTAEELVAEAAEQRIDVLALMIVTVRRVATTHRTTTTIRLTDVSKGKEIFAAPPISNDSDARGGDDPIETSIGRLMTYLDSGLAREPLPSSLKSEHVLQRAVALASSEPANPLSALTELRFYHSLGLLSGEHLKGAFVKMLGEEQGTALAEGTPEEQRAVLDQWLKSEK